jgi:hypothetical protein
MKMEETKIGREDIQPIERYLRQIQRKNCVSQFVMKGIPQIISSYGTKHALSCITLTNQ